MRILLFLLATVAFLAGAGILTIAQSAIHESEAFILFLIGAVFLCGASIVESLNLLGKKLDNFLKSQKIE